MEEKTKKKPVLMVILAKDHDDGKRFCSQNGIPLENVLIPVELSDLPGEDQKLAYVKTARADQAPNYRDIILELRKRSSKPLPFNENY